MFGNLDKSPRQFDCLITDRQSYGS